MKRDEKKKSKEATASRVAEGAAVAAAEQALSSATRAKEAEEIGRAHV